MYSLIRLYAKRWEAFKQQVHLLLKILKSHKIDCRFSRLFYCPCGQQANVSHAGGGQHSLFDNHKPTLTSTCIIVKLKWIYLCGWTVCLLLFVSMLLLPLRCFGSLFGLNIQFMHDAVIKSSQSSDQTPNTFTLHLDWKLYFGST